MATSTQFQHVGALPFLPPFLSWSIDASGLVLAMSGPAEERFSSDVGRVVGIDYRAAFAGERDVLRLVERALSGETLAEVTRAWGARWWNVVYPRRDRTGIVRVEGCSFPFPEEVAVEEPAPEPRRRTWELGGLPRVAHATYQDGDLFSKVDGVAGAFVARHISDAELLALHMEYGSAMRLTSDSSSAPSRRLHLVR